MYFLTFCRNDSYFHIRSDSFLDSRKFDDVDVLAEKVGYVKDFQNNQVDEVTAKK